MSFSSFQVGDHATPVKKRRVALPEKIGKIRQHLTDNYSIFPDDLNDLKNGHMLLLPLLMTDPLERRLKWWQKKFHAR